MLKTVIRSAEKPSSSRRNSLSSWEAGAVNSASRKAEAASSQKRRPVTGHAAPRRARRRSDGSRAGAGPTSRTTGSSSSDARHHEAPPAHAEVGEREGHEAQPGPERAGGAESEMAKAREPEGISSAATITDEHPAGGRQPAHDGLRDAERDEVGREAADSAATTQPSRRTGEQHPTAALAVGQRRQRQGAEHADAHQRQHRALLGLAGVELVGREGDRLASGACR